jgi:hypothetical protein
MALRGPVRESSVFMEAILNPAGFLMQVESEVMDADD